VGDRLNEVQVFSALADGNFKAEFQFIAIAAKKADWHTSNTGMDWEVERSVLYYSKNRFTKAGGR
jgi:hypothetical protein